MSYNMPKMLSSEFQSHSIKIRFLNYFLWHHETIVVYITMYEDVKNSLYSFAYIFTWSSVNSHISSMRMLLKFVEMVITYPGGFGGFSSWPFHRNILNPLLSLHWIKRKSMQFKFFTLSIFLVHHETQHTLPISKYQFIILKHQ